ncbi:hypothetical protein ASPZODRAFT_149707 [Penicilliopsis zonata CBS 506.65]|uniref:FAD dependent oxidoreductase domain-containing protein n=1 Tax=Penicilliopsis zonata CBS 506.65 TaxID=1073090 RepID=A0A1L9STF7_9EURO|nr:hypothetical protein ASPZODRAFT_149707 [Penicilliopsis zonata CBS 506.65]OJJ50367.1 hypothetical protein ASPZODRAFT_149707 [Penicilliopsis zonata CBS 506.65]
MSSELFPSNVIIIGAGVFGLSTALAIAKRHPTTKVTVIDRLVPPVADGESVDTTRCIRADYDDPVYARLAKEAQRKLEDDPDLSRHMFRQGMTWVSDGQPDENTESWKVQFELAKASSNPDDIVIFNSREEVYQTIHGENALPPSNVKPRWTMGYCNLENAFIDAKECIQVYYDRCLRIPSMTVRCGTPVRQITSVNGKATGVILEDGNSVTADLVIVAAGAWSNKLVDLGNRASSIAIAVAWIKVTPEEEARWKGMSITTNLNTGLNLFPPYRGEMKVLCRLGGYKNTVLVQHPEDPSRTMQISHPRTLITHPSDLIPADAEATIRENLREIMPMLADRPFDRTRLCWRSRAPTEDFLIAPHPRIAGIHLATAGSGHGWKFLPVIGDFIVDSVQGTLPRELQEMWAFHRYHERVRPDRNFASIVLETNSIHLSAPPERWRYTARLDHQG